MEHIIAMGWKICFDKTGNQQPRITNCCSQGSDAIKTKLVLAVFNVHGAGHLPMTRDLLLSLI
jgi:hypothetical protein